MLIKLVPQEILVLAYTLRGRHEEVVTLRQQMIPVLQPPLPGSLQLILGMEVHSTLRNRGTTEGVALAQR